MKDYSKYIGLTKGVYTPQSCSNCVKDLMTQRMIERYQKEYQCEGEEYKTRIHDTSRLRSIKNNAESRNIAFLLSDEEAINLLHQDCYYCGKSHADGIDRIDSKGDYEANNVVACCAICNKMKNKFDIDTFFNHIELIYNNHLQKK